MSAPSARAWRASPSRPYTGGFCPIATSLAVEGIDHRAFPISDQEHDRRTRNQFHGDVGGPWPQDVRQLTSARCFRELPANGCNDAAAQRLDASICITLRRAL